MMKPKDGIPTKYCNVGYKCRNLAICHVGHLLVRSFACARHLNLGLQYRFWAHDEMRPLGDYKKEYRLAVIERGLMKIAKGVAAL